MHSLEQFEASSDPPLPGLGGEAITNSFFDVLQRGGETVARSISDALGAAATTQGAMFKSPPHIEKVRYPPSFNPAVLVLTGHFRCIMPGRGPGCVVPTTSYGCTQVYTISISVSGVGLALEVASQRLNCLSSDAAHTVHPMAGQGLNLGLGDASELAQVIDKAMKDGADPGRGNKERHVTLA